MGRLDKLAGQRARQRFEDALAEGVGVKEASRRAGISPRTGRRWRQIGKVPAPIVGTAPSKTLVGRKTDLTAITQRFRDGARLVTLLGPPGMGKTHLARTWMTSEALDLGISEPVFCDLRAATRRADLLTDVAVCLEVHGAGTRTARALGKVLASRSRTLLVLDNFETLVESAATVVSDWLGQAPDLRVLVTSRHALRVQSEVAHELKPLACPDVDAPDEDTWSADAVKLLWSRAIAVEPSLERSQTSAKTLGAIARRLDGIPLALELAATRVRLRDFDQLRAEVDRTALKVVSPFRDRDPRHETLEAAIGQSWRALSPKEQTVLAHLSVFRHGFIEAAAHAVVAPESTEWLEDALAGLREASLIRVADDPTVRRWDLFEAIREFAWERLTASNGLGAARERHARFFLREGERWEAATRTAEGLIARAWLARELANLREAFEWFCGQRQVDACVRLALVLHTAVSPRSFQQALDWATRALDIAKAEGASDERAVELLLRRCASLRDLGQCDAAQQDIEIARKWLVEFDPNDTRLLAQYHLEVGCLRFSIGDSGAAREHLEQALPLTVGDPHLEGRVRAELGWVLTEAFADATGFDHYEAAVARFRATSDSVMEAYCRRHWLVDCRNYRLPIDVHEFERQLRLAKHAQDREAEAETLLSQAIVLLDGGHSQAAYSLAERARRASEAIGFARLAGSCALVVGMAADEIGDDLDIVAKHYRAVSELHKASGDRRLGSLLPIMEAGVLARGGDIESARALLMSGPGRFGVGADVRFEAVHALQSGHLDIAKADRASAAGKPEEERRHMERALDRIANAERSSLPGVSVALLACCHEARHCVRILSRSLEERPLPREVLVVGNGGHWFREDAEATVWLPGGPVLRRLLVELAFAHSRQPGRAVSSSDLIERCWAGERMSHESAQRRLRDAVRRLRNLGLRHRIQTGEGGGYRLDPEVWVTISGGEGTV